MTRVLVSAVSPVVRTGLETIIAAHPALEVAGTPVEVSALVEQIEELRPDVVLLELERQGVEPVASLPLLGNELRHNSAFVVLSDDYGHGAWVAEAFRRGGVRAILPREATADEIVAAVEATAAGLLVLHPSSIDSLLPESLSTAPASPPSASDALTPREIEVLGMIAEGLGNKTIAWRLGISEHTVKFHVASIFSKLGASSRTEAVTLGIKQGLIML